MKLWNIYLVRAEKGAVMEYIASVNAIREPLGKMRGLMRRLRKRYPGEWDLVARLADGDNRHRPQK